jgi:hypothetical protein
VKAPAELQALLDKTLVAALHPEIKATIDAALSRGVPKDVILSWVREKTGGPFAPRGGTLHQACEAYLATK